MNRRESIRLGAASLFATSLGADLSGASAPPEDAGWISLFNGHDVADWDFYQEKVGNKDRNHVVTVHDRVIHILGSTYTGDTQPGFGHLATRREYSNYHLRADFKWGTRRYAPREHAKRNSGILYHMAPNAGAIWPDSIEFQIQESDVADAILINTRALNGASLAGTPAWPEQAGFASKEYVPPLIDAGFARQWFRRDGNFEKLDDWNTVELITLGDKAAHLVNGRIVTTIFNIQARDGTEGDRFVPLSRGRIALEIEGAEILFRNIRVRAIG